jgi:hypothetical protein
VIAALLLGLLWTDYKAGTLDARDLENAAFTVCPPNFAFQGPMGTIET